MFRLYLLQLGSILSIDQIPATGSAAKLFLDLLFGCCDLKIPRLGHFNIHCLLFNYFCARQQSALCFREDVFAAAETPVELRAGLCPSIWLWS